MEDLEQKYIDNIIKIIRENPNTFKCLDEIELKIDMKFLELLDRRERETLFIKTRFTDKIIEVRDNYFYVKPLHLYFECKIVK